MIFLTCLILSEFLTLSNTAPKLGHILFDPLMYEADMLVKKDVPPIPIAVPPKTSTDARRKFVDAEDEPDNTAKKPCHGYDYDDNICKLLDNRILCGYNKNLGQPKDAETVINLGNGCVLRGDRIECGYLIASYMGSQRSSTLTDTSNIQVEEDSKPMKLVKVITKTTPYQDNTEISAIETTKRMNIMEPEQPSMAVTMKQFSTIVYFTRRPTTRNAPVNVFFNNPATPAPKPITFTTKSTTTTITKSKTKNRLPKPRKPRAIRTDERSEITEQNTNTTKPKFMCVDKDNSVFCYELNETQYFIY